MSKNTKVFIIIIALVIVGYLAYGCFNPQSEGGVIESQTQQAFADEVSDTEEPKFNKEGYTDKAKWEKALKNKKTNAKTKLNTYIKKYKKYYTKSQLKKMRAYKTKIANAKSLAAVDKYVKSYKKIVTKAQKKYKAAKVIEKRENQTSYATAMKFKSAGVRYWGGKKFTWYSQRVLPGGGLTKLNKNGRHVGKNQFIYDKDGYIACAGSGKMGSIVSTPWGDAKIYDRGTYGNHIDIYCNF